MVAKVSDPKVYEMQTVLMISQDVNLVSMWETLFEQKSYRVIREADTVCGLQSARILTPALILFNPSDSETPLEKQLELCRDLRLATNGTLIVLAPAKKQAEISDYYRVGVDEYIPLPISPMALLIKCMAWLARQDWIVPRRQPIHLLS